MAYLRTLRRKCQKCGRAAVYELLNAVNASMGFYCARCGEVSEGDLRAAEKRGAAALYEKRGEADR